jgi:hypothetical protein
MRLPRESAIRVQAFASWYGRYRDRTATTRQPVACSRATTGPSCLTLSYQKLIVSFWRLSPATRTELRFDWILTRDKINRMTLFLRRRPTPTAPTAGFSVSRPELDV